MRIGIFFGGSSREREVSFAGGRTVYDNLNKELFEAIPIFIDSFGNMVELDWEYVYKGSIRDFYPPIEYLPKGKGEFQIYAESIENGEEISLAMLSKIGKPFVAEELKQKIDFAFLALHGTYAEDGTIQGLLEWMKIPYSGSGILPSAIGINKRVQKELIANAGFNTPKYVNFTKEQWLAAKDKSTFFNEAKAAVGFPMVVKAANQGSSLGISVINNDDVNEFIKAVQKSFFTYEVYYDDWLDLSEKQKIEFAKELCDIREGIGLPLKVKDDVIYHPYDLIQYLDNSFHESPYVLLESLDSEVEVLVEEFIEGKEFSSIVVKDDDGNAVALPPTEIRKGKEVFDYRSKYLPGLSRKITPIDIEEEKVHAIRQETVKLFEALQFNVYARIDGFIKEDGTIYLNDPNTTSGMMPSSFFFHQAAEIGLNPSQFLTYIIRTSIAERARTITNHNGYYNLLHQLDAELKAFNKAGGDKIKIGVIMGGYSSERHISVESGRNIYEKLASSVKYEPIPIFLAKNPDAYELYVLPINVMLKDNADDIAEKVQNFHQHPVLKQIINECSKITQKYNPNEVNFTPQRISIDELAGLVEGVFIALHGRPGEDGSIQKELERVGLPYNGSSIASSQVTINKYETANILRENGFHVADGMLVYKTDWEADKQAALAKIKQHIQYPLIAKPADDGCSSAVKKIKTDEEMIAFGDMMFREQEELTPSLIPVLHLMPKEEFPQKDFFLVESLIDKKASKHFLEITGGMLTHRNADGSIRYEVFEPSEALAEGEILSLEEKFLAGQGQNITPARYADNPEDFAVISKKVRDELERAAKVLNIEGYSRIDAFVRIFDDNEVEVIFIEVNSLPGMTPATCIFHQCAINNYKPYEFIDKILEYGFTKKQLA